MTTVLLQLADLHLTDRRPRARLDDYFETQFRKLTWVREQAESFQASALLIAGDLFDDPCGVRTKRRLDTALIRFFKGFNCPCLTIRGNHDLEYGRVESLNDHPMGVLEEAGVIVPVGWPARAIVGESPRVLVVGHDYTKEGPGDWLDRLKETQSLRGSRDHFGCGYVVAMTHCYWGDKNDFHHGDQVLGMESLEGTHIDLMLHGHDHRCGGIVETQGDRGGPRYLVGPGGFLRGSLADEDTSRIPTLGVAEFHEGGTFNVRLMEIPCEPAEKVFDLNRYHEEKNLKIVVSEFTEILKHYKSGETSLDPLEVLQERVTPRIVERSRTYVEMARKELLEESV